MVRPSHDKSNPSFSADGNWLAYTSDEFGQHQVIVRSFLGASQKRQMMGQDWQMMTELEGSIPTARWPGTAADQEVVLGFLQGGQVFTAKYRIEGGSFALDAPTPWEGAIASPMLNRPPEYDTFDVDPTGARVLIRKLVEGTGYSEIAR